MSSMQELSAKQEAVRAFIAADLGAGRPCPSHREIAAHFAFASTYAAACHVRALVRKGVLRAVAGKARALRPAVAGADTVDPARLAGIPLLGSIPAGLGQDREQTAEGLIAVDINTIGFKPTRNTFALRVVGDSMIGRHVCDGDIVILEHGPEPRPGQMVAALIDRQSTLKTFLIRNQRAFLKAENPRYPDLIPAEELMIQGVFRALIRKARE